jgi:histidinol-phosphatase (PHP family)
MMPFDFHVHTVFGDGRDTPEEIVKEAISKNMKRIGFSEHSDPVGSYLEMNEEKRAAYIREIKELKEKYKKEIEILLGIEDDLFAPEYDNSELDYVIGSVHYIEANGRLYAVDVSAEETAAIVEKEFGGDYLSYAEAYYEALARLKDKKRVDIIGHFDLLMKFKDRGIFIDEKSERYKNAYKRALDALGNGYIYEINTGAMSRGYRKEPYPSKEILTEIAKRGYRVIFSSDAHEKGNLTYAFSDLEELSSELSLTVCDSPLCKI